MKTFGDKVHQFLRRIGIKETETINFKEAKQRLKEFAESKGQNFYTISVECNNNSMGEKFDFKLYVNPSMAGYGCTIEKAFADLKSKYSLSKHNSIVKDVII